MAESDGVSLAADPGEVVLAAPSLGGAGGLLQRLDGLRMAAAEAVATPLRPLSENLRGFIETVAIDPSGLIWLTGWLHREDRLEFPALLVDRSKMPAGVVLTCYDRPDLPDYAHAVFGAILADWKPSGPDPETFLFFGEQMHQFQRGVRPLQMVDARFAMEQFERIRSLCYGDRTLDLQRLMASGSSWVPDNARAAGILAHASVDRLLLQHSFGCFVEGWALSPLKRIERMALKVGSRVLHADPQAFYTKPRHDLEGAYPNHGALCDQAGFVAAFRGRLDADDFSNPILKVIFTDGTSSNHEVRPEVVRRIGHSARVEDVLTLYPLLQHEAFFGDFALAVGQDQKARMGHCEAHSLAPTKTAVVFILPADRSDCYLAFDEARSLAARLPPEMGMIFLAERKAGRSDVIALSGQLAATSGRPCSLFFVAEAEHGLYLAASALQAAQVERFLLLDRGVMLAPEAWPLALDAMAAAEEAPQVLRLEAETPSPDVEGLAWTTQRLAAATARAPVFVGGLQGDVWLGPGTPPVVHHLPGYRTRAGTAGSPLVERINEVIGARGPQRHG